MNIRVVLETTAKRSFASALDWPGWSRSGRTEEEALAALLAYAPRYAPVAKRTKVSFASPPDTNGFEVVERLTGGSGTEFGVPGEAAQAEEGPASPADIKRLIALLRAAWAELDAAARDAQGATLRKGPRGGGRDLQKMLDHVRDADGSYTSALGAPPPSDSGLEGWPAVREAFVAAIEARNRGELSDRGPRGGARWSPRYAIRRSAWHALDHAWEIQDRSGRAS